MRRRLKDLPLKWKVFAYLLGFCAILLLILWIFQTVLLDAFYRTIKVMEIKSGAGAIASNIDSDALQSLVSGVSQNGEVSVSIVTESGADVYMSDDVNNIFSKMTAQEKIGYVLAAAKNDGEFIRYDIIKNNDFPIAPRPEPDVAPGRIPFGGTLRIQSIVYARLVTASSGETYAVLMRSQISPVGATVTTLRYQLYLVTGIMLLLSVLLALLIARRVSKPIVEINRSAKALATGKYDIQFNGRGFREIGELSSTLNAAATELSKVEVLRRELMANISHDLRTPLALIYSYAEVMHDFPDEFAPDKTQVIMDEARRLTSLVNDILDTTKLESGIRDLSIREYNLTRSLAETTDRLAELIRRDGYTVAFTHEADAFVAADETKITQVYYNLLINAVNYTGPDRRIAVRQTVSGGAVRIEVTDTGEGIAPEEQPYIWDRYYKVDKKHKRAVTGTGLGLSIVKRVVDLHGGDCGVVSEVGKGSTFWFSLRTVPPPEKDVM